MSNTIPLFQAYTPKSWPQYIGKPVDEVVAAIKRENPGFDVIKVEQGSPVTLDLRFNRVRVFYDRNGKVSSEPSTG